MFASLKSLSLLLTLAYSSGAPVFDAVRPAALDLPLRSFHEDVRLAAESGFSSVRQLASIKTVRNSIENLPVSQKFRQLGRDLSRTTPAP